VRPPVWKDAEVPATGNREVHRSELCRRAGDFDETSLRTFD
jgi:hypothetical protein